MFKQIISMILVTGSVAIANPGDEACVWALFLDERAEAETKEQFIGLQKKYPKYFGELSTENFISAKIHVKGLEYIGTTICPDNDPRLFVEIASFKYCSYVDEYPVCMTTDMAVLPETDPCAN